MKAQNRKEIFLKALANGEEPNIKPLTREEELLAKQAKRESESAGGGGAFVVNFTWDNVAKTYVADTDLQTVITTVKNKCSVVGYVEISNVVMAIASLVSIRESEYGNNAVFECLMTDPNHSGEEMYISVTKIIMDNAGTHTIMYNIASAELPS